MPRDGRYVEEVGRYNPLTSPKTIDINQDGVVARALSQQAQFLTIEIARTGAPVAEKKTVSKKAQAKAAAAAEAVAGGCCRSR